MLLSEIAMTLEGMLNSSGNISFLVTDSNQNWFSWKVKDADGNTYTPVVIQAQPVPLMDDYYSTRRYTYTGRLKGLVSERDAIEAVIKAAGDDKWKLDNFIVGDTFNNEGYSQFIATFRLTIIAQTYIVGNDLSAMIDNKSVNIARVTGVFDKMLIPNIKYGEGNNMSATGSEFTLTMPLDATTAPIFAAMADSTYNKAYDIEVDFKAVQVEMQGVLTGGNIIADINNSPVMFNARFIRALPRGIIKIDGHDIPVISYMEQMSATVETRRVERKLTVRGGNVTNMHNLQLINDGSEVAQNIMAEIRDHTNRRFNLNVDGDIIECIIVNGTRSQSEHPNAVINVTMGVAWDE